MFEFFVVDAIDGALELPPITLRGRSTPIDIYCVPREKRLTLYNDIGISA